MPSRGRGLPVVDCYGPIFNAIHFSRPLLNCLLKFFLFNFRNYTLALKAFYLRRYPFLLSNCFLRYKDKIGLTPASNLMRKGEEYTSPVNTGRVNALILSPLKQ